MRRIKCKCKLARRIVFTHLCSIRCMWNTTFDPCLIYPQITGFSLMFFIQKKRNSIVSLYCLLWWLQISISLIEISPINLHHLLMMIMLLSFINIVSLKDLFLTPRLRARWRKQVSIKITQRNKRLQRHNFATLFQTKWKKKPCSRMWEVVYLRIGNGMFE